MVKSEFMDSCIRNAQKTTGDGYTLIELSIVLIIVGLIIGGILTGRDLIRLAEIRATIGQVEKYNAAVNAFRTKYNSFPGDMQFSTAAAFGFFTFTGGLAGTQGYGDGNGLIQSTFTATAEGMTKGSGEVLAFWRHLSEASMVDGQYGMVGTSAINSATGAVSGPVSSMDAYRSLPQAKIGLGNFFPVYAVGAKHYFELHAIEQIMPTGWYSTRSDLLVVPSDAYRIDAKIDDGEPNGGAVLARGRVGAAAGLGEGGLNQPPNNNSLGIKCVTGAFVDPPDPAARYDHSYLNGACALRIQFN